MADRTPTYDLMLMLASTAEPAERGRILGEVEAAISNGGGDLRRRDDWGTRPLTFKITHQREAQYHLLQFVGPTSLLETLSHNLHIADGVLRFRIIKLTPGTPDAPDSPPPIIGAVSAPESRPVAAAASET